VSLNKTGTVKTSGVAKTAFTREAALELFDSWRKSPNAVLLAGATPREGHIYTVTRAISARVNQNFDGFPSAELKRSYQTFLGKPCFVNHANEDPVRARGRVVGARYVENGDDKYIDVIQEVNARKYPRLAKEIEDGGIDSVSMGCVAARTVCSVCDNEATDLFDMCIHVLYAKGQYLPRPDSGEIVLCYETCKDIGFFELSYVFDPADETAVFSNVVTAARRQAFGEVEAPEKVDTLRDDDEAEDGYHQYVTPPPELSDPDLTKVQEMGQVDYDEDEDEDDKKKSDSKDKKADDKKKESAMTRSALPRRRSSAPRTAFSPKSADYGSFRDSPNFANTPGVRQDAVNSVRESIPGGYDAEVVADALHSMGYDYSQIDAGVVDESDLEDAMRNARLATRKTAAVDWQWNDQNGRYLGGDFNSVWGQVYERNGSWAFTVTDDSTAVENLLASNSGYATAEEAMSVAGGIISDPGSAGPQVVYIGDNHRKKATDDLGDYDDDGPNYDSRHPDDRWERPDPNLHSMPNYQKDGSRTAAVTWHKVTDDLLGNGYSTWDLSGTPPAGPQGQVVETDGGSITWYVEDAYSGYTYAQGVATSADEAKDAAETALSACTAKKAASRNAGNRRRAEQEEMSNRRQTEGRPMSRNRTAVRSRKADQSRNDQGVQEDAFITETPPAEPVETGEGEADAPNQSPEDHVAAMNYFAFRRWVTAGTGDRHAVRTAQLHDLRRWAKAFVREAGIEVADLYPMLGRDIHAARIREADLDKRAKDDDDGPSGKKSEGNPFADKKDDDKDDDDSKKKESNRRQAADDDDDKDDSDGNKAETNYEKDPGDGDDKDTDSDDDSDDDDKDDDNKKESSRVVRRRARVRRQADTTMDVAAPDGRVDVERPTADTTDDEAQASQFDKGDFGDNAGDDIANPDLSTDQNWAPGDGKKSGSVPAKKASAAQALRLAEAYANTGIASSEDRWNLVTQFERMASSTVNDRIALLERVIEAQPRKVTGSRGSSPRNAIPQNLGQHVAQREVFAANDEDNSNDFLLFGK
jgi:hypothetical protein